MNAGSTDATLQLLTTWETPIASAVVDRGRLKPGEARNEGVRHASHAWIAFTDGGVELDARWLELLTAAVGPGVDVVFGSYEPLCDTWFRRCAAVAYVPARGPAGVRGPFVASLALSRKAFETAGGFPPYRAAEDLVFLERLSAASLRAAFVPEAVAHWESPPGPRATVQRFAVYSHANLAAGRARFWHLRLLRQYLIVLPALLALLAFGAGAVSLLLLPFWFLVRALKAAWQKRLTFSFDALQPQYVLGAAGVLVLLDLATLAGLLRWLRDPSARSIG